MSAWQLILAITKKIIKGVCFKVKIKIYRGKRLKPEEGTGSDVEVTVNGKPLKHRVYHSPTGFNFGYGGSGPADLARSILWDLIGMEPYPGLYQEFKFAFVMGWGDEWKITSGEIRKWMLEKC
jgi:hypothetical protein